MENNTFDINGTPCRILYEDKNVIAFVKPSGILSQKSETEEPSVIEYLNGYACGKWNAYPVHRLDRNTAGVMICAKNSASCAALSALISSGAVKKEYIAAVHGKIEGSGTLEHELYFDRRKNKAFPVKKGNRKGVRHAKLDYEALRHFSQPEHTVLHITLHTGRTHQIRCQTAAIGHPVLADGKYGGRGDKNTCALWSYRITAEPAELSKTSLKNSAFAKALSENPNLLEASPTGYPFTE